MGFKGRGGLGVGLGHNCLSGFLGWDRAWGLGVGFGDNPLDFGGWDKGNGMQPKPDHFVFQVKQ